MFKHYSVGRLSFFLGISALASACGVGEIGDSLGGSGLDVGFDEAALTCPGVSPDVSVGEGWKSKEASQPAPDALYFEVMARPTAANLDALVAVGAQDIHDFSDAAITVRFSESGLVDAIDDVEYSSDGLFEYDPGVWYNIAISADVVARTYDVEVGRCGEKRRNVIRNARFRSASRVYDQLNTWGVWSSRLSSLELSTPTWMASGTCAPATCETLGSECGQRNDGCNGSLNCGVCGGGQVCSSGACVDEPVSVPPPATCTPASCQSLGAQCGAPSDGCGGTLNCGGCGAGQNCSNNVCVDPPMTPPPPACVPTSCQALGAECGVRSNGCGGTLNCGGCGAGQSCSNSLCIDPPVTPPPPPPACVPTTCQALGAECGTTSNDCGGTLNCGGCSAGQSCSSNVCIDDPVIPPPPPPPPPGAGDPTDRPWAHNTGPSDPGNLSPSGELMITTDGAVYENLDVNGDIWIDADNVTIRNFRINAAGRSYGMKVFDGHSGVVIEDGEITGFGSAGILGVGYTASRLHVHTSGGDAFKIQGVGGPTILQSSFVEKFGLVNGVDHSDAIQSNDSTLTTSNVTIRRNNFYMPYGIGYYPNANFMLQQSLSNWVIEENWLDGGTYTVYCYDYTTQVTVRNNYFGRGALYGLNAPQRPCKSWTGNVWEDTGDPI